MRSTALAKGVQIVSVAVMIRVEAFGLHGLDERAGAVDALGAGHDFLAAHEEVVAVGEERVGGGGVGVEGADGEGELVEGVEVGGVFGADEGAEVFFLGGAGRVVSGFVVIDWSERKGGRVGDGCLF